MERISIINHKGKKIIFFDSKNLTEDEHNEGIMKITDMAIANKIHYVILDVTGTHTTPKVKEVGMREIKRAKSQLGEYFVAIIGLKNIQTIVANVIVQDNFFASDIEEAKEWLVSRTGGAS